MNKGFEKKFVDNKKSKKQIAFDDSFRPAYKFAHVEVKESNVCGSK